MAYGHSMSVEVLIAPPATRPNRGVSAIKYALARVKPCVFAADSRWLHRRRLGGAGEIGFRADVLSFAPIFRREVRYSPFVSASHSRHPFQSDLVEGTAEHREDRRQSSA